MKIKCGLCGEIFDDSILVCPGCGAHFAPRPAVVQRPAPTPDFDVAPSGFNLSKTEVDTSVSAAEDFVSGFNPRHTVEFDNIGFDTSGIPSDSLLSGESEGNSTVIPRPIPKKRKVSVWVTVAVMLLVLAMGVFATVYFIFPRIRLVSEQEEFAEQLAGSWLSEEFTYSSSSDVAVVELITFDEDGSYTLKYMKVDSKYPNGWENGKWTVTSETTGTYKILPQEQRLLLMSTENGQNVYYDLYFVSHDFENGKMVIREYYNDARTSFYDLSYIKK